MIKPLFQKIIAAYNGSQASLSAVMYAIMMAKQLKCQVKVVYVVDTDTIKKLTLTKFMVKDEGESIEQGLQADGERNLAFAQKLAKSKGIKIETELKKGAVWAEIIKTADEYNADLILLGGHKQNNSPSLSRKDMVSLQDGEIIGSAHCSVMVVNVPQLDQLFKLA